MGTEKIAQIIALIAAIKLTLICVSEALFIVADAMGQIDSGLAKGTGLTAWWCACVFSALGGNTSSRYLKKKFVSKNAKPRRRKDEP